MKPQRWPYWDWEDYKAGLYNLEWDPGRTTDDAARILSDSKILKSGMKLAVKTWPRAAAHHLTDDSTNQRAWLGWAACGVLAKIPAHITRAAWWRISEPKREAANDVADIVIAAYRDPYGGTLFERVEAL